MPRLMTARNAFVLVNIVVLTALFVHLKFELWDKNAAAAGSAMTHLPDELYDEQRPEDSSHEPPEEKPLKANGSVKPRRTAVVVASQSSENATWLNEYFPQWEKNIYRVDDQHAPLTVPLNKGRESMVYLTYIIDNYASLPDNVLFIHPNRYQWHNDDPDYDGLPMLRHFQLPYLEKEGYVNIRCAWMLGCPSEIKPLAEEGEHREAVHAGGEYKKAFEHLFPGQQVPDAVGVSCCAQFAATKEKIRERKREDYEKYRKWIMETDLDDAISGRVFEYSWHIPRRSHSLRGVPIVFLPQAFMMRHYFLYAGCASDERLGLGDAKLDIRSSSTTFLYPIDYHYTEEASLARAQKITYKQALEGIYARRDAISTANPFSSRIWGHGNSFVYRQGIICVLNGSGIRVSDLRSQSDSLDLDVTTIIQPILGARAPYESFGVRLLNYADGILVLHVTGNSQSSDSYILAIGTISESPDDGRLVGIVRLTSSSKLFVRHTASYLYYGTHTGRGYDGHHKWEIDGIPLNKTLELPAREKPLLLDDFHGSDIGSTVAFEIHDNYFYAVSNQGTFEVEEIDYTSFYHVVRFPLDSPLPDSVDKNERLYRRQHKQGPIHDSWTDLALQRDERTNETMIVESRREWAQTSSRQSRTFYITKLDFGHDDDVADLPEDDIFRPLLDSSNKPHWKPTPDLYSWSQHPEFSSTEPSPRSFMLARTKFRAYNYGCSSFLDLVEDDRCCNSPSEPPCLRLRIGSRRELGLSCLRSNGKGKAPMAEPKSNFVDSTTQYRQSPIRMWPPPASRCPCSKQLHGVLNPPLPSGGSPSHTRSVTGVLDEQRFIFMIKAGHSYGPSDDNALGTIVVVDFSRPFSSIRAAPSALKTPSLSRSDSKMEDSSRPAPHEWTTKPMRRCQEGSCLNDE
ncbi:f-box domain containing protein [Stemphylium lycopersici]|uniref:F-box domain-containing protein n=1 Tax=Stemphylium lycopersici TaxID=183478 RepID=A0A364MRK0_STELY|nr:f-box domain containing protein [Stemphylium lycopersici]RAR00944.1 F-box domain-containing protein [Stemphylium lycopersici]